MLRKLASLVLVALFTISLAGSVLAADIKGTVSAVEREGRYVTVKSKDGKEVKVRISGSSTELSGVGDRSEIAVGAKVSAKYDESDDRLTASEFKVMK